MSDETVEQMIDRKGLNAPRVTPADVEASIKTEEYHVHGTLTVCILVMQNGFQVVGTSACASVENFDKEVGRKIARKDATDKIWPLLGYALKENLQYRNAFAGRI